jgi:hypothetical protein
MANGEPRVLASAPAGGRRVSTAAVAAGAVLALLGFALGALLAGGRDDEATPLPSIDDSGVPSGFAHSEEGAAQAAAAYTDLFNVDVLLDEERARAVLDRIATPAFAEQQLEELRELRGPITEAAGQPGGIAAVGGAAATDVERYSEAAATVRVVSVVAVGGGAITGSLRVTEQRADLRWQSGDWRASGVDGPSREIVDLDTAPAASEAIRAALEGTTVAR